MKSRFNSICSGCKQKIFKGDEIIKAGSGSWVHKVCPVPKVDDRFSPIEQSFESNGNELEGPEIPTLRVMQCLNCKNESFLQKRLHTITLDNGDKVTAKVYICEKCYYKMEFIEH